MKSQKGAALIVVLSLLTVSLMLGLSSVQSSLVEERLAGNYRAATLSRMVAENGLAWFVDKGKSELSTTVGDPEGCGWGETQGFVYSGYDPKLYDLTIEVCGKGSSEFVVISEGKFGAEENKAVSVLAYVVRFETSGSTPLQGMITCEGGSFSGSGMFDSYDSRLGAYDENSNSGDDAVIASLKRDSEIMISAGSGGEVRGDIFNAGDLSVTNTQKITGDIFSKGDVTFSNSAWGDIVYGNIASEGRVSFDVGSRVHGDVKSLEEVYVKGGWGNGSVIDGNVQSPLVSVPENENRISGNISESMPNYSFESTLKNAVGEQAGILEPGEECPPYGVSDRLGGYQDYSSNGDFSYGHWQVLSLRDPMFDLDYTENNGVDIFKFSDFSVTGAGFKIDRPTVIVVDGDMVVDGDVAFSHWDRIEIAEGAYLEIVTSGKFSSSNADIDFGDNGPLVEFNGQSHPTFSLHTTYDDSAGNCDSGGSGCGVVISGSNSVYGAIVAPNSNVKLEGSGKVFGSINSRRLTIPGGTSIHHDLAYRDLQVESSGGSGTTQKSLGGYCEDHSLEACKNKLHIE